MTRVFCTSTTTATDGSTRASSSTASTERKNGAPAPPSDSGTSMPMTPRSNSLSMSARGMTARSSISRTCGAISPSANARTLARNRSSSSESRVRGLGAGVVISVVVMESLRQKHSRCLPRRYSGDATAARLRGGPGRRAPPSETHRVSWSWRACVKVSPRVCAMEPR